MYNFSMKRQHIFIIFYFFICVLSNFYCLLLTLLILLVLTSNITPTLNICQYCHFFYSRPFPFTYLWLDKENIPQIDIQPIFKCDFCSFLAKITLKSNFYMFFACSLLYGCPRTCFRTLCVCFRTYLRTKTVFPPNFSPNLHCLHIWIRFPRRKPYGCRSFQKIFQIHIIIYNNMHEYCHVFIKRLVF